MLKRVAGRSYALLSHSWRWLSKEQQRGGELLAAILSIVESMLFPSREETLLIKSQTM